MKTNKDNESEKSDPNSESQQYVDFKSFIVLDIKLDKPIIPRKPFDVLAKRYIDKKIKIFFELF